MAGDVVPISFAAEQQLARVRQTALATLPQWQRDVIAERFGIIVALIRGEHSLEATAQLSGKSVSTIRRWRDQFLAGEYAGLATKRTGKKRRVQRWDARALELFQLPSRMNAGEVASRLRVEGYTQVGQRGEVPITPAHVRAFRKTLPSNFDETSPRKLGLHHYHLNETPYVIREWGHVPVGYLYEMDGHTCDFYIEHPDKRGGYIRPELTFLIDVRSQYIVDFWICTFENAMDLRWLLSRAFAEQDHVCHELHIDPGAGRAKTMCDRVVGYGAKLGFDVHFALPGNARGKGLIEGEYKHFEGRFGKLMPTYLHNRTDDAMRLFKSKWDAGKFPKMSVKELCDRIFSEYVTPRRNEPRKGLGGKSPAELWATLVKNPLIAPAVAVCRPRAKRTLRNGRIRLDNRRYELALEWRMQYEDRELIVEYDEWHDQQVWLYDLAGRFIATAPLIGKKPGIPESRVEEKLARTLDGQRKRLALKQAEFEARAGLTHSPVRMLDQFDAPTDAEPSGSEMEAVLKAGHSFAKPKSLPHIPREPSADAMTRVTLLTAEPEDTETAADRYAWAERMLAADTLDPDDARRLAVYLESPEYRSQRLMAETRAAQSSDLSTDNGSYL